MDPAHLAVADAAVSGVAVAMIVAGAVLFVVTMRFWGSAGADPEVLAPLEVMGEKKFARADTEGRIGILNAVRPPGEERIDHVEAPAVLDHEPAEENRPLRTATEPVPSSPSIIDPLLQRQNPPEESHDDL